MLCVPGRYTSYVVLNSKCVSVLVHNRHSPNLDLVYGLYQPSFYCAVMLLIS
jgi:hypothetical protein